MRIRTRIVSLVTLLLSLMLGAGVFAIFQIAEIGHEIVGVTEEDIPLTTVVTNIATVKLEQAVVFERALRFSADTYGADLTARIPFDEARSEFHRLGRLVHHWIDEGRERERYVSGRHGENDMRKELQSAFAKIEDIEKVYGDYERHAEEIFKLVDKGEAKDAEIEALSIAAEEETLRSILDSSLILVNRVTSASADRAKLVRENAASLMFAFVLSAGIIALSLAFFITRSITRPLAKAVYLANEIAAGNKEAKIEGTYQGEVGRLLSAMSNMQESIHQSEQALKEQAEELARSNKELEQFAYVASHDLQEPLRMVASYTQLLARRYRDKLDADADEFINYAVTGVTRMQNLINDLLMYSRVGRKEQKFTRLEMADVIERAKGNLMTALEESKATVIANGLPTIIGDITQLTQLFQNLIGNAIKFRNEKPPEIRVSAALQGGEWLFSVEDNGIGIDPQFADRIFNIFQRLHTQSEYAGTGIGLAICKKIVERHGGRIWVDSQLGKGAKFLFTIPVQQEEIQ